MMAAIFLLSKPLPTCPMKRSLPASYKPRSSDPKCSRAPRGAVQPPTTASSISGGLDLYPACAARAGVMAVGALSDDAFETLLARQFEQLFPFFGLVIGEAHASCRDTCPAAGFRAAAPCVRGARHRANRSRRNREDRRRSRWPGAARPARPKARARACAPGAARSRYARGRRGPRFLRPRWRAWRGKRPADKPVRDTER